MECSDYINAKSEGIHDNPAFCEAFQRRRCHAVIEPQWHGTGGTSLTRPPGRNYRLFHDRRDEFERADRERAGHRITERLVELPGPFTLPEPARIAQVRSPRQKVEADAEVPPLRLPTNRTKETPTSPPPPSHAVMPAGSFHALRVGNPGG